MIASKTMNANQIAIENSPYAGAAVLGTNANGTPRFVDHTQPRSLNWVDLARIQQPSRFAMADLQLDAKREPSAESKAEVEAIKAQILAAKLRKTLDKKDESR